MGFFNLSLTLLCIEQSHWEAANLDEVCGGYVVISFWKCCALKKKKNKHFMHTWDAFLFYHSPQGYKVENNTIKFWSDWRSSGVGFSGNLAIIVWRNFYKTMSINNKMHKLPFLYILPSMLLCQVQLYYVPYNQRNNVHKKKKEDSYLSVWLPMELIITVSGFNSDTNVEGLNSAFLFTCCFVYSK